MRDLSSRATGKQESPPIFLTNLLLLFLRIILHFPIHFSIKKISRNLECAFPCPKLNVHGVGGAFKNEGTVSSCSSRHSSNLQFHSPAFVFSAQLHSSSFLPLFAFFLMNAPKMTDDFNFATRCKSPAVFEKNTAGFQSIMQRQLSVSEDLAPFFFSENPHVQARRCKGDFRKVKASTS